MSHLKDNYNRTDALRDWHESGGVMIIGYDMYRNLSTHKNVRKKKLKNIITEALVDPGKIYVQVMKSWYIKPFFKLFDLIINNYLYT